MKPYSRKSAVKVNRRVTGWAQVFIVIGDASTKHADRAPRPCHPSLAKSKVTVLLNPSLLHFRPHNLQPWFLQQTHTNTSCPPASNTQTRAITKNTHVYTLNGAVTASHPVYPGHITAKSLCAPARQLKRWDMMEWENGASSFLCFF